jgi:serine protease Do
MRFVNLVQTIFIILLAGALLAAEPASTETAPPATYATVQELAKKARDSIVVITVTGRDGAPQGLGTGFVVSSDGLIATNLHVIGEARPISIQTADGKKLQVTGIHATERSRDLAILRVDAKDIPALELADSDKLADGQAIVVMGNPHGLKHSVVSGVISGTREMNDRKMLQLAMPVEPGNSGGPVLDMQARVCGIVTMKSLVTDNLGFAAVVNDLKPLLEKPNPVPIERWLTIGTLDSREWRAIGGARWHQRAGRILVDGLGTGFGGRSLCLSKSNPPELPFELAVRVKLNDESGAAGLVFHSDGGDKHYGFYPTNGKLRLSRFDGADVFSWVVLEEKPSDAYRPGEWNRLKVRVEKDKLLCYVNGELVIESSDTGRMEGAIGLVKFRATQAEFKHFEFGNQLADTKPNSDLATTIAAEIEKLPSLEKLQPEELTALQDSGSASVDSLRKRAEQLQTRADELRRVASDVYMQTVVANLKKIVGENKSEETSEGTDIDLLRAALTIASLDEEDVDVGAYVKQVDRMAEEMQAKLPANADDKTKLATLNQYLFVDSGFHGSRTDYYNKANSYLNRVIDDREGLPITLAVLYIELGQRLGLKLVGVGLPGHFVVRHIPAEGEPQLIDVFEGGEILSRSDAEKKVLEFSGAPATEVHFQETTSRQILLRMLQNLLGVAQNKSDREGMLRYIEAALAIDPTLVRERGLRAIVRFESGRKAAAIADLDWFVEHEPEGIDLAQIRAMREFFRENKPQPSAALLRPQ